MHSSKTCVLLALSILATSCGGGGGGGGGTSVPPDPPSITYSGSTQQMSINVDNAELIIRDAYEGFSFVDTLSDFGISSGTDTIKVDFPLNGPDGGTSRAVGGLKNGLGTITFTFSGYRDEGIQIDGQFIEKITRAESGSASELMALTISRLSFTDYAAGSLLPLTISGTINREFRNSFPGAVRRVSADVVIRDDSTGEMAWLRDLVMDRRSESPAVGYRLAQTYSGRIYNSATGFANLVTEGGFWVQGITSPGTPFGGGRLKVMGAGSAAWLQPLNSTYAAILFDDGNDGVSESGKRVDWSSFDSESLSTAGDHPPETGTVSLKQVRVGVPVNPSALFSVDADGDWLDYQWELATSPVGSAATLSNPASPVPSITPDVAGNYLLTVRVSDGEHVAYDGVNITAVNNPSEPDTGVPVPVLMQPAQGTAGQVMSFDATGSFGSRFSTNGYYDSTLRYTWTISTPPRANTSSLGSSLDGRMSYVPPEAGSYGVLVEVCFNAHSNCSVTQRLITVGQASRFSALGRINSGYALKDPLVADFDADGRADAAFKSGPAGEGPPVYPDSVDILYPRGNGRFEQRKLPMPVIGPMASGDLNGDGVADIAGIGEARLYLALSASDGSFAVHDFPVSPCASGTHRNDVVAIEDANADGRADLLHLDSCGRQLVTRIQTSAGDLELPLTQAIEAHFPNAAIGDVTGDQRADVIRSVSAPDSGTRGKFEVWAADSAGNFSLHQTVSMIGCTCAPEVAIGDTNGDGRNDVVATDTDRFVLARQLPSGLLDRQVYSMMSASSSAYPPIVADFDGDGSDDAWIPGIGLYISTPAGFATPALTPYGPSSALGIGSDTQPMDVNGDGVLDVISGSGAAWEQGDVTGPRVLLAIKP